MAINQILDALTPGDKVGQESVVYAAPLFSPIKKQESAMIPA